MSKEINYTKKEKEIMEILERIILKLKIQKESWLDTYNKYKSSDENIQKLMKEKDDERNDME